MGGSIAHLLDASRDLKEPSPAKAAPHKLARAGIYAAMIAALGMFIASGFMRCPFAAATHQPCPGCGSTRAVLALMHLDFAGALRFNPMAPLIAISIAIIAAEGLYRVARDGHATDLALRGPSSWALKLLVAAVVLELPIWALRFFGLFGGPVPV